MDLCRVAQKWVPAGGKNFTYSQPALDLECETIVSLGQGELQANIPVTTRNV